MNKNGMETNTIFFPFFYSPISFHYSTITRKIYYKRKKERKRKKDVPLTRHVSRTNTDDLNRVTASRKKNLQRAEREDTRRRRGWIEKEDREEGEGEETREERLEKTGRF